MPVPPRLTPGLLLAALGGCVRASGAEADLVPVRLVNVPSARSGPIRPVPYVEGLYPSRIALGRRVFEEPALSGDGSIACSSCHDVRAGGDDGRARSLGIGGAEGAVNAPTVIDACFNVRQFWDGRAGTLEAQIDGPLESPAEMGSTWDAAITVLERAPGYRDAFEDAYPRDGITRATVRDAIASYERSLVTHDARFDAWLMGDDAAIDAREAEGYALFQSYGCSSCHQGANAGGNLFVKFGVMDEYFPEHGTGTAADLGRFNVTGRPEDRHVFKVPSLRMVTETAPYFHDGSAATLDDAIEVMARYQLGRTIPAGDRAAIAAFLRTLGGTVPEAE